MKWWWIAALFVVIWIATRIRGASINSPNAKEESQDSEDEKEEVEDIPQYIDELRDTSESDTMSYREDFADEEGLGDEEWRRKQDQDSTEDRYGSGRH